jgi:hypothetical protein
MSTFDKNDLSSLPQGTLTGDQIPDVITQHMNGTDIVPNADASSVSADKPAVETVPPEIAAEIAKQNASAASSSGNPVKNYADLDDETKKKVDEALKSPELMKALGGQNGGAAPIPVTPEGDFNLEAEMNKLRAEIDWDKIEKDSTGIPVINDDDYKRIASLGVADKKQFKIIVDASIDSILTARDDLKALKDEVVSYGTDEEENKKIADEHEKKIKAAEDLEKSSVETLAVFQDLSRKTVQQLIDDDVFIKQLAYISNEIFDTTIGNGESKTLGIYVPFLKYCVNYTSESFKDRDFLEFIYSTLDPITYKNKFYDSLTNIGVTILNTDKERENESDPDNDMKIYKKISLFSHNIDMMFKYPFSVASQYDEYFDKIYREDGYTSKDFTDKINLGWPKIEDKSSLSDCLNIYLRNFDKLIDGSNYGVLTDHIISEILPNLIKYNTDIEKGRKNTITRKMKNFTEYIFSNALIETFTIAATKKRPITKAADESAVDKTPKIEIVNISENESKRTMLLVLLFIVLQAMYVKCYSNLITKIHDKSESDAFRDMVRYIGSEFILAIDTVLKYNVNDTSKSIKDFISKEWTDQLGDSCTDIFKETDIAKARNETIDASFSLVNNAIRYVWTYLTEVVGLRVDPDKLEYPESEYKVDPAAIAALNSIADISVPKKDSTEILSVGDPALTNLNGNVMN